ncbi:MAG: hypothetical protein JWP44_2861 [Mucilaginibacter sp.]|nr:hypothetical protein [Mucilaginibacter sp.]
MKVLQICAAYKPAYVYGGPTMSVSMLSEKLIKAGIYTEVYTTTANGKNELPVLPGCTVNVDGVGVTYFKRITKDHTHLSPALLKKLWTSVRQFDIVHIHAWWNLVSIFSCIIALIRRVPVLISARGTLSPYSFQNKNKNIKLLIHNMLSRSLLKRCHFHVTSNREYEAIASVVTPKSITDLPNFVRLPVNDHAASAKHSNKFKLIFLSRIEEKKGLDILINVLPLLSFSYNLTIAGDGDIDYINDLKERAKKYEIDKNITWVGFQNDNKFKLLSEHDLLVLPSFDENFGNVVIESLSEGTAVLVSKFVGLSGYVTENNLGWDCELNVQSVGNMINLIQGKQDELKRIRSDAPSRIRADFNEDSLIKRYIEMYKSISNNG